MSGRLRELRSDERGMTLVELMVAIGIGSVVLAAALTIFLNGLSGAATVQDRSEAAQRARAGFDRVTSLVGAQVCNGVTNAGAPVVSGGKNGVFFTASTEDADAIPTGYELRYDGATDQLWEYRYALTGAENVAGYRAWAATSSSSSQLIENATPDGSRHVFRYYGVDDATTGAFVELDADGSGLTASERARVLRIDVALRVLPTRTKSLDNGPGTLMTIQSYVTSNIVTGSLDQGPRC